MNLLSFCINLINFVLIYKKNHTINIDQIVDMKRFDKF